MQTLSLYVGQERMTCSEKSNGMCSSRKYPNAPRRALLLKTPTPLEFPVQGGLVIPPTPWNFCNFLTWLGTLWREFFSQKCCCTIL